MNLYVFDTDHVSLHERGHEPLKAHLLTTPPEHITITVVSIEEIMRGRLAQVRRAIKPDDLKKHITGY